MTVALEERLYTVRQFLELELPDDDKEYELVGGRIVARGTTSARHGRLIGRLIQHLNNYLDTNPVGLAYAEASCTLGQEEGLSYPKPDVCFVVAGRTPAEFDGPIPVAPDLVAEVWSPSDTDEIKRNKIEAYQAAGVGLIWSIYMLEKFVLVYRLDGSRQFLDLQDALQDETLLPGFKLVVGKLFE